MNKFLVKPTYMIDRNGYKRSVEDLACDGEHSGGSGNNIDSTQLNAIETRVTNLETTNNAINNRIDSAETTANEAKTTANAAHTYASGVYERVVTAESTAVKAQEKALEAKNSLSSISADYESLKARIEDLEETDGQASEPIVGKSKMGYTSDFTEYGKNGKYYVYAEWGSEGRSLMFDSNTVLGDVLEELMYCTSEGLTSAHNRLTALENGSGGSSSGGSVTTESIEIQPFLKCTDAGFAEIKSSMGYPEALQKDYVLTTNAKDAIETAYQLGLQVAGTGIINTRTINNHTNALTSHTNSIQSLDTRTGSHTASIGQLENRMTDIELQTTTNKNKIAALEAAGGSGGSITHIGDLNIKSNGGSFNYTDEPAHEQYSFKTLNEVLEFILPVIQDIYNRLYELEYEFYAGNH